ncbi:MAG: glycosyltransferase family 2 protein [Enterocloster bolteae]
MFIPCYNAEKYISETIDSLIKQTFKDFKILVIDDGSTDRSRDIVKQYAMQDHRILLVENEINRGLYILGIEGLNYAIANILR